MSTVYWILWIYCYTFKVDEALSGESDDDTNDDTGSFRITPQHNISLVDDDLENSHSSKECFGKNEDQEGEVITSKWLYFNWILYIYNIALQTLIFCLVVTFNI